MMTEEPNVLDALQDALEVTDFPFDRLSEEVLRFEQPGEWRKFEFYVARRNSWEVLVTTSFPMNIQSKRRQKTLGKLRNLINLIHREPITGKFCHDFTTKGDEDVVTWSYILRLSGNGFFEVELTREVLCDALSEVDEYYPAFQQILLAGVSVDDAYNLAIPEVYGHA